MSPCVRLFTSNVHGASLLSIRIRRHVLEYVGSTVYAPISQSVSPGLAAVVRLCEVHDHGSCTARLSSSKKRVVQTQQATLVQLGI